jgi:hypothetical protein
MERGDDRRGGEVLEVIECEYKGSTVSIACNEW